MRTAALGALLLLTAPAAWAQEVQSGVPAPHIDDRTQRLPGQPSDYDAMLDARIRASVAAAQAYQGPLDGSWTLYDGQGHGVFAFQLVDPPRGGPLEGAWRDVRKPKGVAAWGLVDQLTRDGVALAFTFPETPGAPPISITLQSDATGAWSGQMTENGATQPVTLKRY